MSLTENEKIRYIDMIGQIKQHVICLEALRQRILKTMQQKKSMYQPHLKLVLLEKKIKLALTSQWDIETILSQECVYF